MILFQGNILEISSAECRPFSPSCHMKKPQFQLGLGFHPISSCSLARCADDEVSLNHLWVNGHCSLLSLLHRQTVLSVCLGNFISKKGHRCMQSRRVPDVFLWSFCHIHWKPSVVMMPTLSSLVAPLCHWQQSWHYDDSYFSVYTGIVYWYSRPEMMPSGQFHHVDSRSSDLLILRIVLRAEIVCSLWPRQYVCRFVWVYLCWFYQQFLYCLFTLISQGCFTGTGTIYNCPSASEATLRDMGTIEE